MSESPRKHADLGDQEGLALLLKLQQDANERLEVISELLERLIVQEERTKAHADTLETTTKKLEDLRRSHDEFRADAISKYSELRGTVRGALWTGAVVIALATWVFQKQFEPLLVLPERFTKIEDKQRELGLSLDRVTPPNLRTKGNEYGN